MTAKALVVIDYQNIHLTAHERFAPTGTPKHATLIHPLYLANQIVGRRNHLLMERLADGDGDEIAHAEVAAVEVYRGLPSNRHNPTAYRRSMAQKSEWTRDPRVNVTYRSLRYLWNGRLAEYVAQEKGIDVLVALRVVRAAEIGDFDVVILASHDTDLEPALDDALSRGTCRVETMGWKGRKVLRASDGATVWHTTLDGAAFIRARDRKDYT